jgi:hypothetical protein
MLIRQDKVISIYEFFSLINFFISLVTLLEWINANKPSNVKNPRINISERPILN